MIKELKAGTLVDSSGRFTRINFNNKLAFNHYKEFTENSEIFHKIKCRWLSYNLYFNLILPFYAYQKIKVNSSLRFENKRRFQKFFMLHSNLISVMRHKLLFFGDLILTLFHNFFILKKNKKIFFYYEENDYRLSGFNRSIQLENYSIAKAFSLSEKFKFLFDGDKFFLFRNSFRFPLSFKFNALLTAEDLERCVKLNFQNYQFLKYLYSSVVKSRKVRGLIGLDDILVCGPLLEALSENGIEKIGIQHGLYDSKMIGYCGRDGNNRDFFDTVHVWNERWSEIIKYHNPLIKTVINSGNYLANFSISPTAGLNLICMYESYTDVEKYSKLLNLITKLGIAITIKLHPNVTPNECLAEYPLENLHLVKFVHSLETAVINKDCLFIGTKTSTLTRNELGQFKKYILNNEYNFLNDFSRGDESFVYGDVNNILEKVRDYFETKVI